MEEVKLHRLKVAAKKQGETNKKIREKLRKQMEV